MPGLDVHFTEELRGRIVAGMMMSIRTAKAHGPVNAEFLSGVMAMAENMANSLNIPWPGIVGQVRRAFGENLAGLLKEGEK